MKRILILCLFLVCSPIVFSSGLTIVTVQDTAVYDFPEKMAKYPGGGDAMESFIRKNLVYPDRLKKAGVQGKVYIQFIVEKDGRITNVKVRRGTNPELDKEAKKVIEKMPDWLPGSVRGKKVRVKQTVPITFSL